MDGSGAQGICSSMSHGTSCSTPGNYYIKPGYFSKIYALVATVINAQKSYGPILCRWADKMITMVSPGFIIYEAMP